MDEIKNDKPFTLKDVEDSSLEDKLNLILLTGQLPKLGYSYFLNLGEYYDPTGYHLSPIHFSKDKKFIKKYWFELISSVEFTYEQFYFLSGYVINKNLGTSYQDRLPINPKEKQIGKVIDVATLITIMDGITDFLTDFWVYNVSVHQENDPLLKERIKKKDNPSISDIFYIKTYGV